MAESISIERFSPDAGSDEATWAAVRELCCRTGNDGAAIPAERWQLFGKIWIEPYRLLAPDWSYAALANGRVVGYLTGCPASASFARRQFVRCTLPLLAQILRGRFRSDPYGRSCLRRLLWLENSALHSFPRPMRRAISQSYPAHLHMNVDSDHRRDGIGTRLIARYVDDLRRARIAGVHLFCGGVPVPFYTRMGFCDLAATPVRGHNVHAMGLRL